MKPLVILALLSIGAFGLQGCAHSAPVMGALYSDVDYASGATSNQSGNRVGESCATSYLGLVALGDASIETARRNGGVTLISAVDQKVWSLLGAYTKVCTVVRGR
jgi:hypothetical protein